MAKDDRDMEWRLVATKGRESCRWQAADNSWVALSLGSQGDITKVVVTASDGRSEIVDGYEQGLNLARKWRSDWIQSDTHASPSHTSGPWLPPLPGRGAEASDESNLPLQPNDPPSANGPRVISRKARFFAARATLYLRPCRVITMNS